MNRLLMISAAIVCAGAIVACESEGQREARVQSVLDAQLPGLEACARLYDSLIEASEAVDRALEARDNASFLSANATMDSASNAFFDCVSSWEEDARQALDEAGLQGGMTEPAAQAWMAEQWSKLGLNRQLGDSS